MNRKGQDSEQKNEMLGEFELGQILGCVREFESVFRAEFRHGNLFLATPKGAYDLRMLITNGESLLPSDFLSLCPEDAHKDVQEGARCLAFELYTASGFHFHRANESVLLQYLEARDAEIPKYKKNRNMGAYIKLLEKCNHPPKEIIACLTNLKDMHRNPLMHPEQSIDSFDEANALLGAIHTAVSAMLKEIKQIQDEYTS